ncbi:hypothetical protein, partial [Streptomyces hirsutus]
LRDILVRVEGMGDDRERLERMAAENAGTPALPAAEDTATAPTVPSPRELDHIADRLTAAGPTAPADRHLEITDAHAALEDARDALCAAHTPTARDRAFRQAHAAVKHANAVLRTLEEQPAPADAPAAPTGPNFAAHAAYEATTDASLHLRPEDLRYLTRHLLTLATTAPTGMHTALTDAHATTEDAADAVAAADALEGLQGVKASAAADKRARAAIEQARAAILAVEPAAAQMRGTDMPVTPDTIRAAAHAYLAVNGIAEEHAAIEDGRPTVQVWCSNGAGLGWEVTATITAGVRSTIGHVPAHPPIVLRFRRLDGRLSAAENARRLLWRVNPAKRYLRVEDVEVEFLQDSRV